MAPIWQGSKLSTELLLQNLLHQHDVNRLLSVPVPMEPSA